MLCVSFNVNSLRTRLHQVDEIIEKYRPDIVGLQETKVTDDKFPVEEFTTYGYNLAFIGQKSHYGVALLSRSPLINVQKGFPGDDESAQKRFIAAQVETDGRLINLLNGYFPQGESNTHPTKFPNKRKFYADLLHYAQNHLSPDQPTILMGDMNVAPHDIDIGISEDNRNRWLSSGKCSFLPEEREWMNKLLDWGFTDTYRLLNPEQQEYSWFDYRSRGFERELKRGLRIDFVLATKTLAEHCVDSGIDLEIRAMEKPSDHCPVWAEFSFR